MLIYALSADFNITDGGDVMAGVGDLMMGVEVTS